MAAAALLILWTAGAQGQSADRPLTFEVASVHVSPGPRFPRVGMSGGPGTGDPTRYKIENLNLTGLVMVAYKLDDYQLNAPGWMHETRFIVEARVPEGATKDELRGMLQNLLTDRFKLKLHTEKKEVTISALTVGKGGPKFKPVAPEPPPDDEVPASGPLPKDKDGYPILRRDMVEAMTGDRARIHMETTEDLAHRLALHLHRPIRDATGLTGKFDITVFWDERAGRVDPSASNATTDLGPSLENAVSEQLGLKLVSQKEMIDIFVIDHAEKLPTEN
jgi:uncharacterized protein (TIGR03435 family)